jgi:hypothetical protein
MTGMEQKGLSITPLDLIARLGAAWPIIVPEARRG